MKNTPGNSKLVSLLGLSAGAMALPQAADAQIVYSGVLDEKVGFSSGFGLSYTLDLPGEADLQLIRTSTATPYLATARVDLKRLNGYARIGGYNPGGGYFAKRNAPGATWDGIDPVLCSTGLIGRRQTTTGTAPDGPVGPGDFTDLYVAFRFADSTAGDATRYGWAELSMTVGIGSGPDVTLSGFAYDASGAMIAMGDTGGAIPEPATSAAITALCALAFGGVRRWRAGKKVA